MTKDEFEVRLGREVTADAYEKIELVYTWHPLISNAKGKDEIAAIYKKYGMTMIEDMMARAIRVSEAQGRISKLAGDIVKVKRKAEDECAPLEEEMRKLMAGYEEDDEEDEEDETEE